MGAGGALARVAVALVRHLHQQGVGPDGHAAQRRRDRGVVDELLVEHHLELRVAAHAEVGGPHPEDAAVRDVGVGLDDEPAANQR